MPPIINSASLGRVEVGDDFLFVEATGTELDLVLHTIGMMAANFADPVSTRRRLMLCFLRMDLPFPFIRHASLPGLYTGSRGVVILRESV